MAGARWCKNVKDYGAISARARRTMHPLRRSVSKGAQEITVSESRKGLWFRRVFGDATHVNRLRGLVSYPVKQGSEGRAETGQKPVLATLSRASRTRARAS